MPAAKSKRISKRKAAAIQPEAAKIEAATPDAVSDNEIDDAVLEEYQQEFVTGSDNDEVVMDDDAEDDEEEDDVIVTFDDEEEGVAAPLGDAAAESSEGEQSSDDDENIKAAANDEFIDNTREIKLDPKIQQQVAKKVTKAGKSGKPGVVFLGRIPHGFYEKEMSKYFRQFGQVARLRLSRNKKTGSSKHYAFIEFKHEEVAKIVAETMDGYLLYSHILKCQFVAQEKLHPNTFTDANKKYQVIPWNKVERMRHNKPKSAEQVKANISKLTLKESRKRAKIAALGLDYEFPGYQAKVDKV